MAPGVKTIFLYVLPTFSGAVMCFWPGALQLTFFFQAIISFIQSAALRQTWVREYLGIQPMPTNTKPADQVHLGTINRPTGPNADPKGKMTFVGGALTDIKTAYSSIQKAVNERLEPKTSAHRRSAREVQHAKAYDERRKREIAQEKFERQQEAEARIVEQEERKRQKKAKQRR